MSCAYRLRTQLRPDLGTGGTWTYLGYHPNNKNLISINNTPDIEPLQIDLATDDPLIITTNASSGWYGYQYEFDDKCSTTFNTKVYLQVVSSETDYNICDYWLDWSARAIVNQASLDYVRLTSFKVNSVEYITNPTNFGTFSLYKLEGIACEAVTDHNYVKNFCDTLNNINVPGFTFVYSNRVECDPIYTCGGYKYHTLYYPMDSTFEIIFQEDITSGFGIPQWYNHTKWTQESVYKWTTGAWVDQAACTSCAGETLACNDVVICV